MITKQQYVEYLICTIGNFTSTNLVEHLEGVSHDLIIDYLSNERLTARGEAGLTSCSFLTLFTQRMIFLQHHYPSKYPASCSRSRCYTPGSTRAVNKPALWRSI